VASQILRNASLRLAGNCLVEQFDDGVLLFSEGNQQLSHLEGSSALLIPLLQHGATISELTAELAAKGVPSDTAEEWVASLIDQLAGLSLLRGDLTDRVQRLHPQLVGLGGLTVEITYSSHALADRIAPLFSHLERHGIPADTSYRVADFDAGLVHISEDGRSGLLAPRDQLAVRMKGFLLERMFEWGGSFAALHAACLSDGKGGILLLGSPGGGKSTLALALLTKGYGYASDDVTLVNPDGTVTGVPLAPGIKEGSWTTAEGLGASLSPFPVHRRPDGQSVRFARIDPEKVVPSCAVDLILNLRRAEGAAAELRPMGPEEALGELLRESRSNDGRCSVGTMSALAHLVRGAAAFHLHYAEAMQAADLIAAARKA
jgi:hypothetical protein